MTEYELYDLIYGQLGLLAGLATLYLSLASGYLVVAYLVGEKLTRAQSITVSVMFAVPISIFVIVGTGRILEIRRMAREINALSESSVRTPPDFALYALLLIAIGGILACLKFMWDVRHRKER